MSDYNDGILPTPCLRMDTHFGDEYESVEFGDGTGYIKAAPILAKVGALHEEIDRLRDEHADLRDGIRRLRTEWQLMWELVRNVEHYERFGCQGCPHSGSCGAGTLYDEDCAMSLEIEREKRELGVEV